MTKKIPLSLVLCFFLFAPLSFCEKQQESLKALIEEHLHRTDSLFITLSESIELRKMAIQPTDSLFHRFLLTHPVFLSLSRTNSRGVLVNESASSMEAMPRYSDISQEEWYAVPARSSKTYYGPPHTSGMKTHTVWSKPLFLEKSGGNARFGGVVAARIDLSYILDRVAKQHNGSFRCLDKNNVIYRFSWRDTDAFETFPVIFNGSTLFAVHTAPASGNEMKQRGSPPDTIYQRAAADAPYNNTVIQAPRTERTPPVKKRLDPFNKIRALLGKKNVLSAVVFIPLGLILLVLAVIAIRSAATKNAPSKNIPQIKPPGSAPSAEELTVIDADRKQEIRSLQEEMLQKQILAEIREDIRSEIMQADCRKMEADIRSRIEQETYEKIKRDEGEKIKETALFRLKEEYTEEHRERIRSQILKEEGAELEKDTREALLLEIKQDLIKNMSGDLEKEVLEQLKENIAARLALEHKTELEQTARIALEHDVNAEIREAEFEATAEKIRRELQDEVRRELEEQELDVIRTRTRHDLSEEIARDVRHTEYESLFAHSVKVLEDDIRRKVQEKETDVIRARVLSDVSTEIRNRLAETEREDILKKEREQIRKDAAAIIKNTEFIDIMAQERERIREEIRFLILDERGADIRSEVYDAIVTETRSEIRSEELQTITETMREELKDLVKRDLDRKEREEIYNTLKKNLRQEIKDAITDDEIDAISNQARQEIRNETMAELRENELPGIRETEKKRITQEEYENIVLNVKKEIHEAELQKITKKIRDAIYHETVDQMKSSITGEFQTVYEEKRKEDARLLENEIRTQFRKMIFEEYHYLLGIINNMDTSLRNVEALDSLRHTITRLAEEKNKYKFFNLNATQTESLIEYMQRLQGNLDVYFGNLGNVIQAVKTKFTGILNTLDRGETPDE